MLVVALTGCTSQTQALREPLISSMKLGRTFRKLAGGCGLVGGSVVSISRNSIRVCDASGAAGPAK